MRIGQGYDVHRLVPGRELWLAGIRIPHDRGLEGHSDGDALLHAATDALLGALGQGDLGRHFPSSDESLRGAPSRELLARILPGLAEQALEIAHVDATVVAQEPRLAPYQDAMRESLAAALRAPLERVNLKVTSTDGLGAIGRGEGIAAMAVMLLVPREDS